MRLVVHRKSADSVWTIMRGIDMNYYNEIKNELINNEINKKIKDYSKNRY